MKNLFRRLNGRKGFTLVELIAVIIILMIILYNVGTKLQKKQMEQKEQMAELIALADKTLGEYKATNEGWL